ncbi:unnamed protein product [Oikopleura dioica]|uniref:Uncharacterized protein n=1 Tax=Oikopleura dioica TaxID=34765 RepID=E4Y2R0_OIKDI|nr:unnamed protein product [Oikopleura dioica]CBY37734.1 unnamed protein product [Oikopleura dioica]
MSNENNSERLTFEIGCSAGAEFKGEALFVEHGPPENVDELLESLFEKEEIRAEQRWNFSTKKFEVIPLEINRDLEFIDPVYLQLSNSDKDFRSRTNTADSGFGEFTNHTSANL